jgi:chitinase
VGVKPSQVVLGYGFYGRSFELSDSDCSKPGCKFKGGAHPGPCSDTSGILMYYEIQAVRKQLPDLKPVLDKKAAVKYLVFDKDQWISYDDADTFDLKLKWADEVGFGGTMIWASDTDDDKFSAMSGLMGYEVSHVNTDPDSGGVVALAMTKENVGKSLQGENGQECRALLDYSCKSTRDLRCDHGEDMVGWDRDGCVSVLLLVCTTKATFWR